MSFDAVKRNMPHNHTGSAGEPSLVNRYQTKARTGNIELLVTGLGAIYPPKYLI